MPGVTVRSQPQMALYDLVLSDESSTSWLPYTGIESHFPELITATISVRHSVVTGEREEILAITPPNQSSDLLFNGLANVPREAC